MRNLSKRWTREFFAARGRGCAIAPVAAIAACLCVTGFAHAQNAASKQSQAQSKAATAGAGSKDAAKDLEPAVDTTKSPPPSALEPTVDTSKAPPPSVLEPAVDTSAAQSDASAPAENNASSSAGKARTGARSGKAMDRLELDTTSITGNRELPKVLYIVPWKRSDLGDLLGKPVNSLLDEVLTPVDRDVFKRENRYFTALDQSTAPGATTAAPGANAGAQAPGAATQGAGAQPAPVPQK